jgi:SAM-dependent methyltransferase
MEPEASAPPTAAALDRARRFAQYCAPTFIAVARRAIDLAAVEPGNTVLDVGTSTGLAAFLAAERAGREGSVIGLDPSEAMLAVARERSTGVGYDFIRWQQGDASHLDFAEESFDAVLSVQWLPGVANPFATLEEIRRVLVEGGRVVLTLWSGRQGNEWMQLLEQAFRRAAPEAPAPNAPPLSQPGNVETLLQAAGFQQIEAARVPDRMRLQGQHAFWEWARAVPGWADRIAALPAASQERMRQTLVELVSPFTRDGETTLAREIVYARAISPEAD